jgi:predicted enzyme related to lactoylglutathione lyase
MTSPLGTVIIYARDMQKTAAFYGKHLGFSTTGQVTEGLIELQGSSGGAEILIHQAAKSVKLGQVGVKLSFHVQDIDAFVLAAAKNGLKFGAIIASALLIVLWSGADWSGAGAKSEFSTAYTLSLIGGVGGTVTSVTEIASPAWKFPSAPVPPEIAVILRWSPGAS